MRRLFGGCLALLSLVPSLQASDEIQIPSRAQRVLEVMNQSLNKARQIAVDGLEVELKNSMKSGKLEEANAIKEEIDSLKGEMSAETAEAKGKPTNDAELEAFIRGTNWQFEGNRVIRFHEDGTIRKSWGVLTPRYIIRNMKISFEGREFEFNQSFTKLRETTKLDFMTEGVKTSNAPKPR